MINDAPRPPLIHPIILQHLNSQGFEYDICLVETFLMRYIKQCYLYPWLKPHIIYVKLRLKYVEVKVSP